MRAGASSAWRPRLPPTLDRLPCRISSRPEVAAVVDSPSTTVPPGLRERFTTELAVDLSATRVHEGPAAVQASAMIGARGFAVGNHIALGKGDRGRLLAHEAAHLAQQAHASTLEPTMDQGPADALEQRASSVDPVGDWAAHHPAPRVPALQRAIVPENVASEMVGQHFEVTADIPGPGGTLSAGQDVVAMSWDNAAADVQVQGLLQVSGVSMPVTVTVPKKYLRPARPSSTAMHPYGARTGAQAASVEEGEARLSQWEARESSYASPKAAALWQRQKARLQASLETRRRVLNRRLIQETMFNRFDPIIEAEVAAANSAAGLSGKASLDPNLLKSMLFQESQLGTAGYHLEEPPSHPVKTRFNLGQVIDSSGLALLTLIEREQPALVATFQLANLRSDLASAQGEKARLEHKRQSGQALSADEAARLTELARLSAASWETFIWSYQAAGASVGFSDAVDALFASATPERNFDYRFWIHMAVLWLFEKKRPGRSWAETIRAYNGSGDRARHYRDAVVRRSGAAAAAASAGRSYVPSGI